MRQGLEPGKLPFGVEKDDQAFLCSVKCLRNEEDGEPSRGVAQGPVGGGRGQSLGQVLSLLSSREPLKV